MPNQNLKTTLARLIRGAGLLWRLDRARFWREAITLAAMVMVLVLIELLGRLNTSEFFDAGAALTLLLCVAMAASWHRRLELRWSRRLIRRVRLQAVRLQRWRFQWGLDLRRVPPVPKRCPPALYALPLVLAVVSIAAAAWATLAGSPLRTPVSQISYVVYVVGLAVLWSGLLSVVLIAAMLPAWTVLDMVKSHVSWPERKSRRAAWVGIGVYFAVIVAAIFVLPVWIATFILIATVALAATLPWLPRTWYPDCLWRSAGSGGAGEGGVFSVSLGTLFSLQLVCVALVPLTLALIALGPIAFGLNAYPIDSPISTSLGRIAAWVSCGGLLVFLGLLMFHISIARWYDPSRPAATSVHISGVEDAKEQRRIRNLLSRQRWTARFAPRQPLRSDVKIHIAAQLATETSRLRASQDKNNATFSITTEQLDDPEFRERIARRDVIQRRRLLMSGLESIFRRAASRKGRSGCGYWVAPHFWFVDGLTRDQFDDEDTNVLDVIPPLYYKAFPQPARRHFFEICRGLEIDLIFVEDGVNFRQLRRVLRVLFERFDIDGGRQRLSDVHFSGLPKVRVMLHDYDFEEPPMKTKYPEPDYQHLGRVRILHVFRDRGEDEPQTELPEAPDWEFTPTDAPVLVG